MWNNYIIEEDWDFGFVEVSTDGGTTWTEQKVFDEADAARCRPPTATPTRTAGCTTIGDKKYGLTGDSHGWRHDYVNLAPFAGQTSSCGCATPPTPGSRSAAGSPTTSSVTGGGADDVERRRRGRRQRLDASGRHLHRHRRRRAGTSTPARRSSAHYYLVEWRNFDGFDKGLQYAYDTELLPTTRGRSRRSRTTRPGMLVWYRDTTYGNINRVTSPT